MSTEAKRPRMSGGGGRRRSPPRTEPSRVVFVGDLLANTTERDVLEEMRQYGPVATVTMMPRNRQALVEFAELRDAEALVARFGSGGRRALVRDSPVVVNYSRSAQINEPRKEYKSTAATSLLLLTLYRHTTEVDADTFRRIGCPFGRLTRVAVLRGRGGLHAVLEFASVEEAARAKPQLNGADIYANCNTLRCEFVTRRVFELLPLEGCALVEEWPAGGGGYGRSRGGGGGGSLLDDSGVGGDRDRRRSSAEHHHQSLHLARPPTPPPPPQPPLHHSRYQRRETADFHSQREDAASWGQRQLERQPDASGCILHVSGLPDSVNCDRLFNLLCLYGNVRLVKFFASKRGQALVEMLDRQSAVQCVSFLHDECLLGSRMLVELSRQSCIRSVREAVSLPDGTPSIKEFQDGQRQQQQRRSLNRFLTESSVRKNPPMKPGRVLYFWGFPSQGGESDLRRLLAGQGAPEPPPEGVEFFSADHRSGLIRFDSTEDALAVVCLANHALCRLDGDGQQQRPWMVKMCFSVSSGSRRWGQQGQKQQQHQKLDQASTVDSHEDDVVGDGDFDVEVANDVGVGER